MSITPPSPPAAIERWEVLDLLASLVQKSLVVYEEDGQEQGRYRLLETVRHYVWDRLLEAGEAEVVQRAHTRFFLALAEAAAPQLRGPEQEAWLERLEREHDNLRSALAWGDAHAAGPQLGLRFAGALLFFWDTHSHLTEGREHISRALSRTRGERTVERARALHAAGYLAVRQCDYTAARALGEESLEIARELGSGGDVAWSLGVLGTLFQEIGEPQKARSLQEESLAIWRELGGTHRVRGELNNLGLSAVYQKEFSQARAWLEESLAMSREVGDRTGMSVTLNNLGMAALGQEDRAGAHSLFAESLRIKWELGMRMGCAWGLEGLAGVAAVQGQPDRAARLFGAADAVREAEGHPANVPVRELYEPYQAMARARLGEAGFAAAWAEGRALSLEDAIKYALEDREPA